MTKTEDKDDVVSRVLNRDKRGAVLEAEQDLRAILERFQAEIPGDRSAFDLCILSLLGQLYDRALDSVIDTIELGKR